ncbi:glyoxalase [Mycolicibacterium novocastrense]|uniref:VOC family protein n=1 Tax=Mycolicibacterium novocastrense TaxID=59813 RepID=UPI00074AF314|nr:VOC family protein [Mycolicibacterium novocastrense]KUH69043.1 glyoxalase [Mycolicibacterium novocastrense]KUH69239.1 glyoxalase [Mycolicibacterium novocastrense]KUH71304.1 glyoxalase [Mycolicibacterium novocastrense]
MSDDVPGITGIHHISITVTDLEASLAWYQRLLGADRLPMKFPHYEREDTGYGELLIDPRSGVVIGLHTNIGNDGNRFDEARTGLDHVALNVASRDELDAWTRRLDELGIEHSGVRAADEPFPFATVVFRDPDNIQLELFTLG